MDNKSLAIIAVVLAFLVPIAGIILGVIALKRAGREAGRGKELAIAAIAIGVVTTLIFVPLLLVFIGAGAYFGVLSPSEMIPEQCSFPNPLVCFDHQVTARDISLELQLFGEENLTLNSFTVVSDSVKGGQCGTSTAVVLHQNGQTSTVHIPGCAFTDAGTKINRYAITVSYTAANGAPGQVTGKIVAKSP